jgi:hypothetical protein
MQRLRWRQHLHSRQKEKRVQRLRTLSPNRILCCGRLQRGGNHGTDHLRAGRLLVSTRHCHCQQN